jgi:polyisoprenoid-binding protein YceI
MVCLILVQLAQTAFSQQIYITRNGSASFVSNAPLEVIKAESKEVHGAIDLSNRTFLFTIDNNSFKGFNSPLQQEHFYENYMETHLYPTSSFKGKIIEEIDMSSNADQVVRAKGMLDIHGVLQERIIKGTLKVVNDRIFVNANFTVLLNDHQIKIPKVVNQKITETIEVSISAEFIQEND